MNKLFTHIEKPVPVVFVIVFILLKIRICGNNEYTWL